MFNNLFSSMVTANEGTMSFLNKLIINPISETFSFLAEYFGSKPGFISILGIFIALYLMAMLFSGVFVLLRMGISYCIFCHKEKKRHEILEIRRKERLRAEERLAYDQQFDELYDTFVV